MRPGAFACWGMAAILWWPLAQIVSGVGDRQNSNRLTALSTPTLRPRADGKGTTIFERRQVPLAFAFLDLLASIAAQPHRAILSVYVWPL